MSRQDYDRMRALLFKTDRTAKEDSELSLLCFLFRTHHQGSKPEPVQA
jgi:hypothetical protein